MQTHCYRPGLRKVGTFALSLLMIGLLFSSCASRKDVAYVQTPEQVMTVASNGLQDARIRAKDLLTVTVESSNPEAVAAFNGIYWTPNQQYSTYAQQARTFLVDNEGNVELPVVGLTHVGGYTMRWLIMGKGSMEKTKPTEKTDDSQQLIEFMKYLREKDEKIELLIKEMTELKAKYDIVSKKLEK